MDEFLKTARHGEWEDYERAKGMAKPLVGYHSENEQLRTAAAYDVAIRHIADALGL